jgi:hypothetical protein
MEDIKRLFSMSYRLNGAVSTKEKVPTFNMDLHKQVDIAQSFTQLDLLKNCSIAEISMEN